MRIAAKVDRNQAEIVEAFRKFGCSVLPLHQMGKGCPDILVAKRQKSVLVEIKDGNKCASGQKLTPDQIIFHSEWRGRIVVINNLVGVCDLVKELEA